MIEFQELRRRFLCTFLWADEKSFLAEMVIYMEKKGLSRIQWNQPIGLKAEMY